VRNTTRALTRHYLDHLDLRGDVLEIGGHRLDNPRLTGAQVPAPPDPVSTLQPALTKISGELQQMDAELARLRRAVSRPSWPERAYRKVHRVLVGGRS